MKTDKIIYLIDQENIKYLFSIFHDAKSDIRLVGGSIRDTLIDREVKDIDTATPLEPNDILALLREHNIEYDDYALRYGSIIAFINNQKIQITTLREDINQLGRHTSVLYTKDWEKDAARRDFTFNALYLDIDQKIYDFYNGEKDLKEKRIKFIGEIEDRIKEDYLRIYRYFRFLGLFDQSKIDEITLSFVEKYIHESLVVLTNDVIRQEVLKMFNMPFPLNCFFRSNIKFKWVEILKEHFIKTNYNIGLEKCLNKIDNIIN